MPLTPMFHVHAWGMPYLFTMLGTKQVYPGKYEPEMLLKLIVSQKVTFSHCVPTILAMLLDDPASRDVDLEGLDAILLSHAHGDHVSGAGVVARRWGAPVGATRATWARIRPRLGRREHGNRGNNRVGDDDQRIKGYHRQDSDIPG